MAHILIGSMPTAGHVNPLLPLARALVARGHQVAWYTGLKHRKRVEATGARYLAMKRTRDYDEGELDTVFPGRAGLRGLAALKFDIKHVFIDNGIPQLHDIEEILQEFPADMMLGEPGFVGGILHHERAGLPLAVLNVLPMGLSSDDCAPFGLGLLPDVSRLGRLRNRALNWAMPSVIFRDVQAHWQAQRARVGLSTHEWLMDVGKRVSLYLQPTIPSLEYPRSDLPSHVRFIGMLPADPPPDLGLPEWWAELDAGRPVVHVSQGTIANVRPDLIGPAIQGLAGEDVLVVVSTGGRPVASLRLGTLPQNVRISTFLPYPQLLPKTAVMVTNGGYGGVQMAVSAGVPLVVAGTSEDKLEVSARIAWSGAGLRLKTNTPTPAAVGSAVMRLLRDNAFRARAQTLRAEFASYDAVKLGTALIEQLIAKNRPRLA
jgi:MGT family glycosyltransferase